MTSISHAPDSWRTMTSKHIVSTDFGEVEVLVGGDKQKPAMVFWPSLMLDASMWSFQFEHYAHDYSIILINPPGIGGSAPLRRVITVADSVTTMVQILDGLGIDKAIVVGNSWGSLVAAVLAAEHPERVTAGIITNGTASVSTPELVEQMTGMVAGLEPCETAPDWLVPAVQQGFGSTHADGHNPEFLAYLGQVAREDPVSIANAVRGIILERQDLHETARKIHGVPILIIAGEEDRVFDLAQVKSMADVIKGSTFVLLPKTGHLAARENPQAVNAAIDAFLTRRMAG